MPANQNEHRSRQLSHPETIRALVVASHGVLWKALVDLVSRQPGIEVCASVKNVRDVHGSLAENGSQSVVILDWPVADTSDSRVLGELLKVYPAARWLAVSLYNDLFSVKRALDMGVNGYVTKLMAAEVICTAIRALAAGQEYFSPDVLDGLPQAFAKEILA